MKIFNLGNGHTLEVEKANAYLKIFKACGYIEVA